MSPAALPQGRDELVVRVHPADAEGGSDAIARRPKEKSSHRCSQTTQVVSPRAVFCRAQGRDRNQSREAPHDSPNGARGQLAGNPPPSLLRILRRDDLALRRRPLQLRGGRRTVSRRFSRRQPFHDRLLNSFQGDPLLPRIPSPGQYQRRLIDGLRVARRRIQPAPLPRYRMPLTPPMDDHHPGAGRHRAGIDLAGFHGGPGRRHSALRERGCRAGHARHGKKWDHRVEDPGGVHVASPFAASISDSDAGHLRRSILRMWTAAPPCSRAK